MAGSASGRVFVGGHFRSMDDAAWVPTVISTSRERLIEHDPAIEIANEIVQHGTEWIRGLGRHACR